MESPERIAKLETQMDALKEDVREVKEDIKELHSRITTGNREITDHIDRKIDALAKADHDQHEGMTKKIDQINKRVDVLERWRWMIVGAAIVVGYLVGHIEVLSRIIK
jgi:uncharacterized protein involved in exopolysaccharide biosynthesis